MKYGRVEVYVHSDEVTQNKGACIVRIQCQSEAAARTEEFKEFCEKAAMRHYAADVVGVEVDELFPELAEERKTLEKALREQVVVTGVQVLQLQLGGFEFGSEKGVRLQTADPGPEGFAVVKSEEEIRAAFDSM